MGGLISGRVIRMQPQSLVNSLHSDTVGKGLGRGKKYWCDFWEVGESWDFTQVEVRMEEKETEIRDGGMQTRYAV